MLRQWQHRGTNPPFEPVQEIEKISLQQLPSPLLSKLINSFKGICLSRLIKRVLGMEYTKDEGVATGRRARINERRGRNLLQVPLHSPFHHRWRALFDKSRAPTPCKQGRRLNKSNYLRKARERAFATEGKIISRGGRIFRCFRYRKLPVRSTLKLSVREYLLVWREIPRVNVERSGIQILWKFPRVSCHVCPVKTISINFSRWIQINVPYPIFIFFRF